MALTVSHLRDIPVLRTLETVYYRVAFIPAAGDADPFLVVPGIGRWATDWTLYTGSSDTVVWAEYCRNHPQDIDDADITGGAGLDVHSLAALGDLEVGDPLARRALFELTFAFERLADLTSEWARVCLQKAGFDLASVYADEQDGYGDCPELAALYDRLDWEALKVPSAAWRQPDGHCFPIFRPGAARHVRTTKTVDAARPSVSVAYATTYRDGHRPDWF